MFVHFREVMRVTNKAETDKFMIVKMYGISISPVYSVWY